MQALADELARRLGRDRCWKVRWPVSPAVKASGLALEDAEGELANGSMPSTTSSAAQQQQQQQQQGDASDDGSRKDANEVLMKDGHAALNQYITAAEAYPIRGLFR